MTSQAASSFLDSVPSVLVQDRLQPSNVRLIMEAWMDHHNDQSFPWLPPKPEQVERKFTLPLQKDQCACTCQRKQHKKIVKKNGKIRRGECLNCGDCPSYKEACIRGVFDLDGVQLQSDPKQRAVVDHKTTGSRIDDDRWVDQFWFDSQGTEFLWAADKLHQGRVSRFIINALQLSVVPSSNSKCKEHGVPYSECGVEHIKWKAIGPYHRTPEHTSQWLSEMVVKTREFYLMVNRHPSPAEVSQSRQLRDVHRTGTYKIYGGCDNCELLQWCGKDCRPIQGLRAFEIRNRDYREDDGWERRSDRFYVSNSLISSFIGCPQQALGRFWGLTINSIAAPLEAGRACHSAWEAWFKGKPSSVALKRFDEIYHN